MKNVFAMIALLISGSVASAHTADTSWEVLMADTNLKIDAPVVFMGHAVDYTFVCVDGQMLRTKKAVAQRETIFIGKNRSKEVITGYKYLYTPINYTRTVSDCKYIGKNREVCTDKVVSGTYPLTVNVKVSKKMSSRNDTYKFLFNKALTVPSCH
ncbi:hypothetical protein ACES2I_07560 [Bdellovibrio bacteriovorus]|uniref:hypothetical protein n=1 Tax=Bdellovibrio bacteriovorus TaxID=959 RepID=UPI0035A652EA